MAVGPWQTSRPFPFLDGEVDLVPRLTHLVSLQQPAGVESHFTEFVSRALLRNPHWTHGWLNPARTMHAFFRERLGRTLTHTARTKYRWNVKLPSRPTWLRYRHCRRELAATDVLLIWNRTAKTGFVLDAMGAENCVHWEHGSVWHAGREGERRRYLRRIPLVIANSRAASRVLQLGWDYRGPICVCLNALRPTMRPVEPVAKEYPAGRAIRLGVAARLAPVKGIAMVLHTVKRLVEQSVDVELHVAGAGPDAERLRSLARDLDISSAVFFHGAVQNMQRFYLRIDCLLHVPLTEAFGLVAIEAAAHGCPVVAAAVDGLPEAVAHGISGYCVTPTLPLSEYSNLGGLVSGVPEQVYDPAGDVMRVPRLVDPAALAAAVCRVLSEPRAFERMSRSASEHVLQSYDFDAHVDAVMGAITAFRSR